MRYSDTVVSQNDLGSSIVALGGDVEGKESYAVREALEDLTSKKARRIFVDLSGVECIDENSLAALIEANQRAVTYGGKLGLIAIGPALRAVLELAQLDMVFPFYPDRDSALSAA